MALSCSASRPNSAEIFRPSPAKISPRIYVYAKQGFIKSLPVTPAKIVKCLSEVKEFLISEKLHRLGIQRQSVDVHVNVEDLFAHQEMGQYWSPLGAFVVANAMMLIVPFQAAAETCVADRSPVEMPLLLAVALVGAIVGGLLARQRKGELKKLNEQLRQINAALRKQAKIESYAPTLSYAPVGSSRIPEDEVIVDSRKHDLISLLKSGKNFLRNQDPGKACEAFKTALELAKNLKDPIEEKKAARGLGASLQRLGKYREAIKFHSMVLEISDREGEDSGSTEAYGAIADCYTELGDLEQAAKFYDKYIMRGSTLQLRRAQDLSSYDLWRKRSTFLSWNCEEEREKERNRKMRREWLERQRKNIWWQIGNGGGGWDDGSGGGEDEERIKQIF